MPEIMFLGPAGRLEGRYAPAPSSVRNPPIALVLHPHPLYGGAMNNKVVHHLHHMFHQRGFSVMRFNFRGVGRSQGEYDEGAGELSDAAAALDWLQASNPNSRIFWVAGVSFGAWIGMQLLMRRPEVSAFVSVAPPSNLYDFSFLAPCPSSGLIVNGDSDQIAPMHDVTKLAEKLRTQKGITVEHQVVPGANHFFEGKIAALTTVVDAYVERRMAELEAQETESEKA